MRQSWYLVVDSAGVSKSPLPLQRGAMPFAHKTQQKSTTEGSVKEKDNFGWRCCNGAMMVYAKQ